MTQIVKIGNISTQIRGVSYSKSDAVSNMQEGYLPVLRANNIQEQGLILEDFVYVPESKVSEKQRILAGDVVIAASSGSISLVGKAASAKEDINAGFGAFCKILRPNTELVDPRYFANYFQTQQYRQIISNLAAGANINNLKNEHLDDLEIPLPPLAEQRRIASILDQAGELRQKRQQAIEKLDQLLQATFIDMFGDPVSNPKGWRSDKNLGDVADIVSGITKGRKITGKSLREIPYLAVSNVQDKYLNLSIIKTIEASDDEIERYRLKQGDLLLTEGGDPDKLGRGTLWNNEVDECIHQNHVFRVRLTSKEFTPNYLNWIVGSEYGKRYFLKSAKQTTGIASINMGQLKKLPLLTPPLDLQIQFDERCIKIHQIKNQLVDSYKDINNLFSSLQNQAFNGTL